MQSGLSKLVGRVLYPPVLVYVSEFSKKSRRAARAFPHDVRPGMLVRLMPFTVVQQQSSREAISLAPWLQPGDTRSAPMSLTVLTVYRGDQKPLKRLRTHELALVTGLKPRC